MRNVFLTKAGKSEALRTNKKFSMVFRNIADKEITGLDRYNCEGTKKISAGKLGFKVAVTKETRNSWDLSLLFLLLSRRNCFFHNDIRLTCLSGNLSSATK